MHRAQHTVELARPPAEVFPYLVEPALMQRWVGGLVEFTPHAEGPRVGARSTQKVEQAGRTWEVVSEIVALVPAERLDVRTEGSVFRSLIGYRLEPAGSGTRLHGTVETELKGLGRRLLGGVAARASERKLTADFERLKRLLEPA